MKILLSLTSAATLLTAGLSLPLIAGDAAPGFVDFGKFPAPESGGQFVEVNVKTQLLALAARLAEKKEPEIADLLRGLKSIRVNVMEVDDSNRDELGLRLQKIRSDLDRKGWERIVAVQEKDQEVGVYLKQRGEDAIEGIVVTVIDGGKEAIFVNVVGDITPEKLGLIGDRLNIDPLKKVSAVTKRKS